MAAPTPEPSSAWKVLIVLPFSPKMSIKALSLVINSSFITVCNERTLQAVVETLGILNIEIRPLQHHIRPVEIFPHYWISEHAKEPTCSM